MTNPQSIARPYAKAAFEAAKTANQLPMWSLAFKKLSYAAQDLKVKSALKNPNYAKSQLITLFKAVVGETINNEIDNFLKILSENKRFNLLPDISKLFETDCEKESGYLSLIATSAFALDENKKQDVKKKLSEQFKSTCDITFHIDENLLGGLLVRSANWVMDGTVKGNLERLKTLLA